MSVASRTVRASAPDGIAFVALLGFAIVMYTIPSEWIRGLESVRLALIFAGAAAGLMAFTRLTGRQPVFFDGVRGVAAILFGLWTLASTSWSIYPEVTEEHAIETLKLVAVFLTMVNVVTTPRRLAVFAAVMVLASAVTSWHVIEWYHRGEDLVEGFRSRWLGIYADPNHMAMDIGIVVPLGVAIALHRKSPWWLRALCAIAVPLAVTAIVYSFSRGGFVGLVVAITVWMFLEKRRRLTTLVLGGVLAVALALLAPASFWERNETLTDLGDDASAMGRVYAWEVAARMSEDHPIAGVGGGGFRYAWPLYARPEARTAFVAHNVFLDVVGELGFVGLLLYLIFTSGAAAGGVAGTRSASSGWIAAGIAAAMVGYIVCSLISGYTTSAHFYVLCGLAACAERVMRGEMLAPAHSAAPSSAWVPATGFLPPSSR